jgi:hypothetical protein
MRRPPRASALVAVLSSVLVVSACGDSDNGSGENGSAGKTRTDLVSPGQVKRYRDGTPERTVLRWWREAQFNNASGIVGLYARGADVTLDELNRQLAKAAPSFRGVPVIQEVEYDGNRAIVYLILRSKAKNPKGETVDVERPLAIKLERIRGHWRLSNNLYLEQVVARVDRARSKLRRK